MSGRGKDPLLPKPVVIGIAVVVTVVWAASAVAAVLNPGQAGPLLAISSLMAMVLGAAFGISGNLLKKEAPPDKTEKSETP